MLEITQRTPTPRHVLAAWDLKWACLGTVRARKRKSVALDGEIHHKEEGKVPTED